MAKQQNTPEFINDPIGHDQDVQDAALFGRPQDNSSTATLKHNSVPEHNSVSDMVHNSVPAVELNGLPNSDYLEFSKELLKRRAGAEYDMRHERRGPALIFNQIKFQKRKHPQKTPTERFASELDVSAFEKQLERLGFDVQLYVDYKQVDLLDKVQKLAEEDHTQNDCMLIAIFSHGEYNGIIHAHDTTFTLNEILEKFTDENCPTLRGKPKLFFLQACQGAGIDRDGKIEECHEMKKRRMEREKELLQHPDFLIAHPSAHGLVSWRRLDYGSWFIQGLCNVLKEYGTNLDLITILTYVSQHVARHETTGGGKQVPCFTSMLTRIVRFDDEKTQKPGTKH